MKYQFSISSSRFTHTETYDTEEGLDSEWLSNYSESELKDASYILEDVKFLDNAHVLFDLVKSLLDNKDCPPWIQAMPTVNHLVCEFKRI